MKREHISQQSYIDWLKSLGCVFYAPLTEFETHDLISGTDITVYSRSSLTWDNAQQMYLFDNAINSGNYYVNCFSWTELNLGVAVSNSLGSVRYTVLQTGKIVASTNGYRYFAGPTTVRGNNIYLYCPLTRLTDYDPGNGLCKLAQVITNNTNTYYKDGVQVLTKTLTKDGGLSLTELNKQVVIGNVYWGTNVQYGSEYLKDVMVFNTALDLTTIRKIQGYE